MRLKNLDLLVTMIIAMLNLLWALFPSHPPVIGIILALPLVFVLPGYTLTEALFHKRSLDASHRLVFSLGLSLAIDVLSGLVLNLLPIGLQAISWAMFLGLLTAVFSLLAMYLRRGALVNVIQPLRKTWHPQGPPTAPLHPVPLHFQSFRPRYTTLVFGLAIVVAALAILFAVIGVILQPHPGFTQLWMLSAVQAGKRCAVRLGVHSFESTPVTYRITMTTEGVMVTSWPSVVLVPQEEWDRLVPITPTANGNVHVEAQLYRLDKPHAVYRQVNVTLHSCPRSHVTSSPYSSLASTYSGTIYDLLGNSSGTFFEPPAAGEESKRDTPHPGQGIASPCTPCSIVTILANIATNMSLRGIQQSEGIITDYSVRTSL
jgi:uncharacterized membrane protein